VTFKRFPDDFLFGAATSSFQIEGSTHADGRGPSIWDTFCAEPGRIKDATDGRVACEHYTRMPQDVALMASLGLQAYRFSVAWPRVLPEGRGRIEPRGLDFYERLVDALLARGIQPWCTLYHWDLPDVLEQRGGWPARETCDAFVEYADVVTRRLGDRVKHWITHNEPWCISMLGYMTGEQAPGKRDWGLALRAAHHVLLSHGQAVPVIRANSAGAQVGIVVNLCPAEPASPSAADADATRAFDGWFNRWYLDPVHGRGYPQDVIEDYARKGHIPAPSLDFVRPGDLETMGVQTDFLGINYYSRAVIRSEAVPEHENAPPTVVADGPRTDMGWEVAPAALTRLLRDLHTTYGPQALYITENGCAYPTAPDADGRVRDVERVAYFASHLDACHDAVSAGVPLKGYFAWSLMDNFEWAWGYEKRFGLVWVDYETQTRVLKDSAHLYRQVISARGLDA